MMKKRYLAIPILAIALHFLLSNLLYFLVERLVLDVFHISPQQFMNYSYWGEILIYAVLILVFFTLYKLLWRKEISEPRTATNFKDVLGSLVVGFGICGISGLWIMLAEQLPSLQKSVEAMNAGAENPRSVPSSPPCFLRRKSSARYQMRVQFPESVPAR